MAHGVVEIWEVQNLMKESDRLETQETQDSRTAIQVQRQSATEPGRTDAADEV